MNPWGDPHARAGRLRRWLDLRQSGAQLDRAIGLFRRLDDMHAPLESAGVKFIAQNGGGPGVRLRKS